jgi:flagellar biosynthesis/type III secretory pathway protein FliH
VPDIALPEGFLPLADALRRLPHHASEKRASEEKLARESAVPATRDIAHGEEIRDFIEEVALLRLRALEVFERARERLLERFADEVLARELQMQPADISAVARRLLAEFADDPPLTFLVAPADAARLSVDMTVRVDASLSPGDIVVAFSAGSIESPLRLRASAILAEISREEGVG